jgi:hypothetical protein
LADVRSIKDQGERGFTGSDCSRRMVHDAQMYGRIPTLREPFDNSRFWLNSVNFGLIFIVRQQGSPLGLEPVKPRSRDLDLRRGHERQSSV